MRDGAVPGDQTWISARFLACFVRLFEMGLAHSVECWEGDQLVGGVFGVAVGGLFSAESMFKRRTDASKVALCRLVHSLAAADFEVIDIQVLTEHTASLGAVEISRGTYLSRVERAVRAYPEAAHARSFGRLGTDIVPSFRSCYSTAMAPKREGELDELVVAESKEKLQKPPLYSVLLHNDHFTTMEFVVYVLVTIFGKSEEDAFRVMLEVHNAGVGVAGVYTYEIAETKAQKVMEIAREQEYPLMCSVQEA